MTMATMESMCKEKNQTTNLLIQALQGPQCPDRNVSIPEL